MKIGKCRHPKIGLNYWERKDPILNNAGYDLFKSNVKLIRIERTAFADFLSRCSDSVPGIHDSRILCENVGL